MISFTIPGKPIGKGRPRVTRNGTYTPAKTAAAERAIQWLAKDAMKGQPMLGGAMEMTIRAYFEPPSSWSAKKRFAAIERPVVTKPDADNIAKLVMDSLRRIVYADDAQITSIHVMKLYGSVTQTFVTIRPA